MSIRPMLAKGIEPHQVDEFPLVCTTKLDGVRAVIVDGVVQSRSGKAIPNRFIQQEFGHEKFNGLDGELIVGEPHADDVYRMTVSGVMTHDGEPDVIFYVFDDYLYEGTMTERWLSLCNNEAVHDAERIEVLRLHQVNNVDELVELETDFLEKGYEGVIARHPHKPYKHGRSTVKEAGMLKIKQFKDSEAEIIGAVELMHNANEQKKNSLGYAERSTHKDNKVPMGVMGAIRVRDLETEQEFQIGTGFDDADREWFWQNQDNINGLIVKYKYFSVGVKDLPRHPVYLGLRDTRDMD